MAAELGMLISLTRRTVWTSAMRRLEASGESMLAWQLLAHLVRAGKSTQSALAAGIAQHPAGVSRLLDDLEKQGYVSRRRDPADRRRVHVVALARGKRRFESILPDVVKAVDQALQPLGDSERRTLRDLLRKVVAQDSDRAPSSKVG